jgi:hypothetical protein
MNTRIANKVATRFRTYPTAYSPQQVQEAFRTLGKPIPVSDWETYSQQREALRPAPQSATAGTPTYGEMSVGDLKALAKDKGLSGYSKMKKDELVELLTNS